MFKREEYVINLKQDFSVTQLLTPITLFVSLTATGCKSGHFGIFAGT